MSNKRRSNLAGAAKVYDCTRELAEELHETITRKFEKRKVYSHFKDNIWDVYLANMD